MTVVKTGSFEAAHVLSMYSGDCGNLHGHSYHYKIAISGATGTDHMVLDFNLVKDTIKIMDHAFIASGADLQGDMERQIVITCNTFRKKYIQLPDGYRSTCEDMSRWIGESIKRARSGIDVSVELWETDSGHALYRSWEHGKLISVPIDGTIPGEVIDENK